MSKFKLFTFCALMLLLPLLSIDVTADTRVNTCPGIMHDPRPLTNDSPKADFTINVGDRDGSKATGWKVEFQCGVIQQQVNASLATDPQSIVATITRNPNPGQGCEFFTGNHTFLVKAVINGSENPWCSGAYNVTNADEQCELTLNPSDRIIVSEPLTVSGDYLTNGGHFNLFIDNDKNKLGIELPTPSFPPITIPTNNLSPTNHTIYLKSNSGIMVGGALVGVSEPLCPIHFTIGTPQSPGRVISRKGKIISGPASLARGKIITGCDDPNNPGIATAVGCIHTNPDQLTKDLLTFAIGIGGGLAFLMMLLGAFQMLTSAGNPETLNASKERLTSAVIGLLIVIFAILLLQIIGVDILSIPGFGK